MAFQPRMVSVIEGIKVLDELKCRAWNGVVADLWHAECGAGSTGEYVSPHPRLFVLLEKHGGDFLTSQAPIGRGASSDAHDHPICFVPAGVPLWGRADTGTRIRHLDVHFDPAMLSEKLGEDLDRDRLGELRLMFRDDRILSLARLIAQECESGDPRHALYGDGLTLALLIDVLALGAHAPRKRTPLTPWQARRVTDFIEANCARAIRLEELARLLDLSQSYFSHAFKAATGLPPHQWQMQARVRRAQQLLLQDSAPLTEIAAEAGFADQAHLTRVFRRVVGETPAAWQRGRRVIRSSAAGLLPTTPKKDG
jgi:AraC family transcriptional regulator